MEVVLDSGVELRQQHLIFDVLGLLSSLVLALQHPGHYLLHLLLDHSEILFTEQIGNFSNGQNRIDVLNEGLLRYLIV